MPSVSIVTATYQRPEVLRYAIESVRSSTLRDWEMVVVGDACTDHTGEVVASFADSRLRFVNLERNVGEQSGPNNEGARQARGEILAYLNHDDLFFPDHLARGLACLEKSGADLCFSLLAAARPAAGGEEGLAERGFDLFGASHSGRYEPYVYAPASSWVLRAGLVRALRGWRPARDCYGESSQDFLFRAWKAGFDLRASAHLGVLALQSGARPGCYVHGDASEHAHFAAALREDPGLRERILLQTAADQAGRLARARHELSLPRRRQLISGPARWLGLSPRAMENFFKFRGRRGGQIRRLNARRGLGRDHGRNRT